MCGALLESKCMPVRRLVPLCLLPLLILAAEPPAIRRQGVVNAASQRPAAVGGAIARGSLITIHGVRFAAGVEGNRVVLESGGKVRALTVVKAAPERLDAWIPADVALGPARLTVTSNGIAGAPETVAILKSAPGLFAANGEGWGPARSANTPANSIAPGGRLTLEATGLAPGETLQLRVGGEAARLLSLRAARAPKYTAEIAIEVPADAPEGCYVPVFARLPGAPPSNTVTISIHRGGGPCVSAADDPAAGWNGGKTAILLLSRTVRRAADAPQDRAEDEMAAGFFDVPADKARASPLLVPPPPGVCTTWAGSLDAGKPVGNSMWSLLFGGITGEGLDAGSSIAMHNQTVQLRIPGVRGAPGLYRRTLSGGPPHVGSRNRLSLDAGRLGISGSGGPQAGPFAVALPAPLPFTLASRPPDSIARSQSVTVEWTAANPQGVMAIVAIGSDPNLNVAGMTYCLAPQSAGRIAIPADLLAQLPAGRGVLMMASWSGQTYTPPPAGIARMTGLSVFARSFEVRIE